MAKPKTKDASKRAPAKPRLAKPARKPAAAKAAAAKPVADAAAKPKRPRAKPTAAAAPTGSLVHPERLERLWDAVQDVRHARRDSPRTARLLAGGPPKLAQKVVEEAGEVAIEAVLGDREALVNESVDLLYNLVALWNGLGIELPVIWAEMDRREATLGMAEKLPKTDDV